MAPKMVPEIIILPEGLLILGEGLLTNPEYIYIYRNIGDNPVNEDRTKYKVWTMSSPVVVFSSPVVVLSSPVVVLSGLAEHGRGLVPRADFPDLNS